MSSKKSWLPMERLRKQMDGTLPLVGMDIVDVAVLRWLMTGLERYPARSEIRESMSSAAKKLHLTETTLRSKVGRLLKSGFLKEWEVFVNPNAIGLHVALARYDVLPSSAKDDVIRKFRLIEGMWLILNNYGNTIGTSFYYEDEAQLEKKIELMRRIANSEHVTYGETLFPPCNYHFKKADLAIIECIQESPTLTYSAIAKRIHLSSRTIRRRLNRMIRERALFVTFNFDLTKSSGILIADLLVEHSNEKMAGKTQEQVLARFGQRIFAAILGNRKFSNFSMILDNIADVDTVLAEAKWLIGVKEAFIDVAEEYIGLFGPFREQVKRLSKMQDWESSTPRLVSSTLS